MEKIQFENEEKQQSICIVFLHSTTDGTRVNLNMEIKF